MMKRLTRVTFPEKNPFVIDDIDVNKLFISKKEPYGKDSPLR